MDKEEKKYIIIGLVVAVTLAIIFGVPAWMELYNIPPPDLLPVLIITLYILIIGLCIFVATKILLRYKRPIEYSINKHYRKRLLKEIGLELEKEVTTKNIALSDQEKDEVLKELTERICNDIIHGRLLPTYSVYKVPDKPNSMKLGGLIFTVSQDSAENLAKKMTELYNNQKYRKRLYRYFSLFI